MRPKCWRVESGVPVSRLAAVGEHPLERMASLCAVGDFASVYLGLLGGVDPTPILPIEILKARIAGAAAARRERRGRNQGDPCGAAREPGHRRHQVLRLPRVRLLVDAGRVDPLAGRLWQPAAAAGRWSTVATVGNSRASVRLWARALPVCVRRVDRALQRRRSLLALRRRPQDSAPRRADQPDGSDRGAVGGHRS